MQRQAKEYWCEVDLTDRVTWDQVSPVVLRQVRREFGKRGTIVGDLDVEYDSQDCSVINGHVVTRYFITGRVIPSSYTISGAVLWT